MHCRHAAAADGGGGKRGGGCGRGGRATAGDGVEFGGGAGATAGWDDDEDYTGDRPVRRARQIPALLNPTGVEKLKGLFEERCADKARLSELTSAIRQGGVTDKLVSRELKRLGLKFGTLPEWLVSGVPPTRCASGHV